MMMPGLIVLTRAPRFPHRLRPSRATSSLVSKSGKHEESLLFDLAEASGDRVTLRWYAQFAGKWDFKTSWRVRRSVSSARPPLLSRLVRHWRIGCPNTHNDPTKG